MHARYALLVALVLGCAEDSDDEEQVSTDAAVVDEADAEGATGCGEPEFQRVQGPGLNFDIFAYEASHPDADGDAAWPGAADGAPAPTAGPPCSRPGVRPWHSIKWRDADAACKQIGWRLCTGEEWQRACQGPDGTAYTYGSSFKAGVCNVREGYRAEGTDFASESPTGHFAGCVSAEGLFDMTGNLWEWTAERDESDAQIRYYQGAGWRTIAERHRDQNLVCTEKTRLLRLSAPSFANQDVGFRCCRAPQ